MENEFKGTKGKWVIKQDHPDGQIIGISAQNENDSLDWMSLTLFNAKSIEKQQANAQLIADAGNVRQQINFDLPELLKQRNEMLEMLGEIIHIFEDNNNSSDESDLLKKAKELIKESTTI